MNAEAGNCLPCNQLEKEFSHLRRDWWWLMLFGLLLTVCGAAAVIFPAVTAKTSIFAVVALGVVLMVAGIATIITSVWAGKWSGTLIQMLAGILYLVVGFMITEAPIRSTATLTLFIAAFFIMAGGFRIVASLSVRFPFWGWALLNGIVTLLLGLVIYRNFPGDFLWVIGLLVGIEMLLHGWTWIMLSLAIKHLPAKAE
jgi:uncharacterized membrane protein HdeD (DUF308 family)